MGISSLPFDVVSAILDFAYCAYFFYNPPWSPAFPQAQVCHLWRNLLLPKLHHTSRVFTTKYEDSCARHHNGTLNATLSLGYGHYVKKIEVDNLSYTLFSRLKTYTSETWTTLYFPKNAWPGLTRLHVNAYACNLPKAQKNLFFESIPESCNTFLQSLPNLESLVFKGSSIVSFTNATIYRVVDARNVLVDGTSLSNESQSFCLYLDSCKQISIGCHSVLTPIEYFSTLESLTHLAFINIPLSTPWSGLFSFTSSDPIVNLDKLKHLELSFDGLMLMHIDDTSQESLDGLQPSYQLRFPNLKTLVFKHCMNDLRFLDYLKHSLPQKIPYVFLGGDIEEVIPVITALPKIAKLKVDLCSQIIPNGVNRHMFFDAAFGSRSVADLAILQCGFGHIPVCLHYSRWPKLVRLFINNNMPLHLAISLLDCLPNLEKLYMAWISGRSLYYTSGFDFNTKPILKLFETKVSQLEIGQFGYSRTNKFPVETTLYLSARLTNLQALKLYHVTPIETIGFMSILHEKYPHTRDVSVSYQLAS